MRLLIDSHALIWFCEGNPALSVTARTAMEDSGNERLVSHATPWEMAIKLALGKATAQRRFLNDLSRRSECQRFCDASAEL